MLNDERYPVFGRDVSVIDVPVVDDMEGVIDDWDNPYDQTKPIEIHIPPKPISAIEILDGKCRICKDTRLLSIKRTRNLNKLENSSELNRLIKDMIENGLDPSREFCVLCVNCIMFIKKISKVRKESGLSEMTVEQLTKVLTR